MRPDGGLVHGELFAQAGESSAMLAVEGLGIKALECPAELVELAALARVGGLNVEPGIGADASYLGLHRFLDAADQREKGLRTRSHCLFAGHCCACFARSL